MNKFEVSADTVVIWINDCVAGFSIKQIDELTKIINRYCLPRPTYKDGTPIQFGDTVKRKGLKAREVISSISYYDDGNSYVNGSTPKEIIRVEPDSWEKLEEDAESLTYQDVIRRAKALAGVEDE